MIEIISNIQFARKAAPRVLSRSCALALVFVMTGCSVSVPLGGFADMTPLGSVNKTAGVADAHSDPDSHSLDMVTLGTLAPRHPAPDATQALLTAYLDPSDMLAARSALDSALNAQNGPRTVVWANPGTSSGGSFTPLSQKTEAGCKAFLSDIHTAAALHPQSLQGTACLGRNGLWTIRNLASVDKTG